MFSLTLEFGKNNYFNKYPYFSAVHWLLHSKLALFQFNNLLLLSRHIAMTTRLLWRALGLSALLCTISHFSRADNQPGPSAPEQGVTFSHVYKIDIPGSSSCKLERMSTQEETGYSDQNNKQQECKYEKKIQTRNRSMCMHFLCNMQRDFGLFSTFTLDISVVLKCVTISVFCDLIKFEFC